MRVLVLLALVLIAANSVCAAICFVQDCAPVRSQCHGDKHAAGSCSDSHAANIDPASSMCGLMAIAETPAMLDPTLHTCAGVKPELTASPPLPSDRLLSNLRI